MADGKTSKYIIGFSTSRGQVVHQHPGRTLKNSDIWGLGVFGSNNNNQELQQLLDTESFQGRNRLLPYPQEEKTVYAATAYLSNISHLFRLAVGFVGLSGRVKTLSMDDVGRVNTLSIDDVGRIKTLF
nr:hypothetical protein [Tanacetum cinerariifolium]